MRKTISSDFLPWDSLAFSLLQLLFLEVYIMSTELQEHFSREVIVCLDYFTVLSSNSRQRHLAQWSGTKWEWVCCLRFFLRLGLKQWKNQTGNSSFCWGGKHGVSLLLLRLGGRETQWQFSYFSCHFDSSRKEQAQLFLSNLPSTPSLSDIEVARPCIFSFLERKM